LKDDGVVDWQGLKALGIPYSHAHIWRMMAAVDFPQTFKLGKHHNSHPVWWLSQVNEWLHFHAMHCFGSGGIHADLSLTRPNRSSATRSIDNSLGRIFLH
jgi:predicted DNA-binding transcriptional regulator AlpA